MSERYSMVFRLPSRLYLEGSPVIIEAGAIQKDNDTNKLLVQIKFRNVSSKNIVACKVKVEAYSVIGDLLDGIESFSYLDLDVPTSESFGSKTPIILPNYETRRVIVRVEQIVFKDSSIWNLHTDAEWTSIPEQLTIEEKLRNPELIKQFKIEAGEESKYCPEINCGLFFCSCGTVNPDSSGRCIKCNRTYTELLNLTDKDYLYPLIEKRLNTEERIKQERILARKRKLRIIKIVVPTVFILLLATIALVIVNNRYEEGVRLMRVGQYTKAQRILESLSFYRDSAELNLKCNYLLGLEAMDHEDYEGAVSWFEAAGDYSDASQLLEDARDYSELVNIRNVLETSMAEGYSMLCDLDSNLPEAEELMDLCEAYIPYCGDFHWDQDGFRGPFSSDFALSEYGSVYWLYDSDVNPTYNNRSFYDDRMLVEDMSITNTLNANADFEVCVYFRNGRISTRYSYYADYDTVGYRVTNRSNFQDSGEIFAVPD